MEDFGYYSEEAEGHFRVLTAVMSPSSQPPLLSVAQPLYKCFHYGPAWTYSDLPGASAL